MSDSVLIVFRPLDESLDCSQQRSTQFRQPVLDTWRYFRVHAAIDQPVALEVAQSHGQHTSTDSVDLSSEFTESEGLLLQQCDHQK